MKKIFSLFLFLPLTVLASTLDQPVALLEKVTHYHKIHPKLFAHFTLSVNNKPETGLLYSYMTGSTKSIKLFFGTEDDLDKNQSDFSYWVVDKNKLWIYLNSSKVLVEQSIPEYFNTIGILGSGLSSYFASYKKFSIEEIKLPTETKGQDLVVDRLNFSEPIKEQAPFSSVSLDITKDGLQIATRGTSGNVSGTGGTINFSFILSNVQTDNDFDESSVFKITPGDNVQILRNVLIAN